jgi:hypothetical protein
VVTWDRSDPEANRVVARFWERVLPPVPGSEFVPWPVPDRGHRIFEFEGIWPDVLGPFLEEWLGEGFPPEALPPFGEGPRHRGPSWWLPGPDAEGEAPPELFDEEGRPPGMGGLLEEFLGSLFEDLGPGDGMGGLLEEFFGKEGPGSLFEEFGGDGLGGLLEEFLGEQGIPGGLLGMLGRLDDMMGELADYLESRGIDTVTMTGPLGATWVVWDFFDEEAAEVVAEFFSDRLQGGEPPASGGRELPEWDWPFDDGGP